MTEEGRVLRVIATPIAPMRKAADANSGLVTEALLGERVQVAESDDAFVKAELEEDGYVGYLPRAMLAAAGKDAEPPDHRCQDLPVQQTGHQVAAARRALSQLPGGGE